MQTGDRAQAYGTVCRGIRAHAVLYLAADESAMMTSHTFAIDGGLRGHPTGASILKPCKFARACPDYGWDG